MSIKNNRSTKNSIIFILVFILSSLPCFTQDRTRGKTDDETIYESTIRETTLYENSIAENNIYEKTIYEIDINKYEFSEYINGVYVVQLKTNDYIMSQRNIERQLKIGEITANLAIGFAVTIPILIIVPPMKVVTDILIGMAIDATISGVFSYIESGGNSREALYGAIEGAADGFKWGAVMSLAIEYISTAAKGVKRAGQVSNAKRVVQKTEIPMPKKIASINDAAKTIIPNDVKNVFRVIPDPKRPPRGWNAMEFDNAKGLLTRFGPQSEPLTYTIYISKNGERVIIGSDGLRYFVNGDIIKPFDNIPEFRSRGGQRARNAGYVGKTYNDYGVEVPYVNKIVYYDGKPVYWTGPIFDKASKFDAFLPEGMLLKGDTPQFQECVKQLKKWIKENPELAAERFTPRELAMIEHSNDRIAGYIWHHSEETGKIQLIRQDVHEYHGHTAGRELWGGGGEYR